MMAAIIPLNKTNEEMEEILEKIQINYAIMKITKKTGQYIPPMSAALSLYKDVNTFHFYAATNQKGE